MLTVILQRGAYLARGQRLFVMRVVRILIVGRWCDWRLYAPRLWMLALNEGRACRSGLLQSGGCGGTQRGAKRGTRRFVARDPVIQHGLPSYHR